MASQIIRNVTQSMKRMVAYQHQYRCAGANCGILLPPTWECDHIIPLWKIAMDPSLIDGDPNQLSNLQPLCPNCHRTKTLVEQLERDWLQSQNIDKLNLHSVNLRTIEINAVDACVPPPPKFYVCLKCHAKYSPHFPDHQCWVHGFHKQFSCSMENDPEAV